MISQVTLEEPAAENLAPYPGRDELLQEHYPMVRSIVRGMLSHLPPCADVEELHSVGVTGLVAAVDRYDPVHAKTFKAYVSTRIRGAILDELRRMDALPRTRRAKVRRLRQTVETLEQHLGRAPNDSEIGEALGLNQEEFRRFRQQAEPVVLMSLDQSPSSDDNEGVNLHETVADEQAVDVPARLERVEMANRVAGMIAELPERQRRILIQYYYEGKRLGEIAEIFGVTEARICQIHTQAVAKLRRDFQKLN